ncbi:MAG: hypothetical protein M3N13_02915 [Candidatus Eremiobacteraeota bacterium]|nr:hypothetical protein [Candidatus Eremiobacteraeota bacterium]
MNAFEKLFLGFLDAAPAVVPIFVHSPQGLLVLNASEILLAGVLARFAPKAAAPAVATPVVAAVAVVTETA